MIACSALGIVGSCWACIPVTLVLLRFFSRPSTVDGSTTDEADDDPYECGFTAVVLSIIALVFLLFVTWCFCAASDEFLQKSAEVDQLDPPSKTSKISNALSVCLRSFGRLCLSSSLCVLWPFEVK